MSTKTSLFTKFPFAAEPVNRQYQTPGSGKLVRIDRVENNCYGVLPNGVGYCAPDEQLGREKVALNVLF
jgi:hypothetical protein